MKRIFLVCLAVLMLISMPCPVFAAGKTVLTLDIPQGTSIVYTGDMTADAFALAVGYSLADDCVGLSGYAVTVRWDPEVLALNTNYRADMDDNEMARCTGCYFEDLYDDGLLIAPSGMRAVNFRNVPKGEITVVSIGLEDMPYREAVLFVLDMIPLCDNTVATISVEVKEIVGLMSSEGMIEDYQSRTELCLQIGDAPLFGDVDADGTVSVADALLIKRHACGQTQLSISAFASADLNGDKIIDAKDYLRLCKKLQNA